MDGPSTRIPTVSRVAGDTLVELVYDPGQRRTNLVVSRFGGLWNLESEAVIDGEHLVPYSAKNSLIATGCVLLPSGPIDFGTKAELVADIRAFLHRYVDLSPAFELVAAHYVLLTWVHDAFNELCYLRLRGDYGTGKTRGLLAIGSLCYKPFFASAASTVSPIFHVQDLLGGTLVLDEADLSLSDARADLVKILNNGTVKGMPVLRTMQTRNKEFEPRAFRVYGPKLIAMRSAFDDPALESRFITEETGQQQLRDDIPIQVPSSLSDEALALRNRLLHFRLSQFFNIKTDASVALPGVEPRLNQTALSLLSLVEEASDRKIIEAELIAENAALMAERNETIEAAVLTAMQAVFAARNAKQASVRSITDQFNGSHAREFGGPVSCRWIGRILRRKLHLKTQKSHGIYVVPMSEKPKIDVLLARLSGTPEDKA